MHRSNLRSERVTATMDEKTKSSLPMFHCVSSAVPRHVTSAGITQRFGSLTEYPGDCLRTRVATEPRPFPVLRGLFCVFFVSCPCLLFLLFFFVFVFGLLLQITSSSPEKAWRQTGACVPELLSSTTTFRWLE